MSENLSDCHNSGSREARDTAKHSTMPRRALHNKESSGLRCQQCRGQAPLGCVGTMLPWERSTGLSHVLHLYSKRDLTGSFALYVGSPGPTFP